MDNFLKKIHEGFDADKDIEPGLFREVLRHINEASVEGLSQSKHPTHEKSFLKKLKHSNEVFSAFKCHSMGVKMAERLHDDKGQLRSFEEWKKSVQGIASHQTGAWLRTEYDTAVLRAHQAAQWQEFERNKDIFPNLRWMPTTSPSPEQVHERFWAQKLTLPVDDPFWNEHHPANRWNCKCSLEATDDEVSDVGESKEASDTPSAQRGLENNPRDGIIFSDKHPYFPDSCSACPFYKPKGLKNKLKALFFNKEKDCYNCPFIDKAVEKAKLTDGEVYVPSDKYGERFQISNEADPTDLEDNKRVSIALLESFPELQVKIRPHHRIHGHKNPELEIGGLIADNKKVKSENGITNGFKKAKEQGCSSVVIDLDAEVKQLNIEKVSKHIADRKADFKSGQIQECYVVFGGKAVRITIPDRNDIRQVLAQLQEKG